MAEAWVRIPTEEERKRMQAVARTAGGPAHPYDFGFFPAMGRLQMAHPRIGAAFSGFFSQVMFEPGALDRREREMIAAISSAAQDCHY